MASNHYNWKIFNAAVIVALFSSVAKVIAALKDIVVAAYFGSGENVDAFILGALLPLLSVSVFSAPYSLTLIPLVTKYKVSGDIKSALQVFEKYTTKLILLLLVLTAIFIISAGPISLSLTPDRGILFEKTKIALSYTALLVLFAGLSQHLTSMLNALEVFALPSLAQAISPITIIISLYLTAETNSAYALPLGAVIGNGLQLLFLVVYYLIYRSSVRAQNPSTTVPLQIESPWKQWAPLFLSALLMSSTEIVDNLMAAHLGAGDVSILNYGFKITALMISIVASSLASAAFPYISQMIERGENALLFQTLRTYVRLILLCSLIVVLFVSYFSQEIIRLLFERGHFYSFDTARAAFVQQMAILQLPFYLLNILFMRVIMALRCNSYLTVITVVSIILNMVLNVLFSQSIGVAGIALSTSCVYLWSSLALGMIVLRKKLATNN